MELGTVFNEIKAVLALKMLAYNRCVCRISFMCVSQCLVKLRRLYVAYQTKYDVFNEEFLVKTAVNGQIILRIMP